MFIPQRRKREIAANARERLNRQEDRLNARLGDLGDFTRRHVPAMYHGGQILCLRCARAIGGEHINELPETPCANCGRPIGAA